MNQPHPDDHDRLEREIIAQVRAGAAAAARLVQQMLRARRTRTPDRNPGGRRPRPAMPRPNAAVASTATDMAARWAIAESQHRYWREEAQKYRDQAADATAEKRSAGADADGADARAADYLDRAERAEFNADVADGHAQHWQNELHTHYGTDLADLRESAAPAQHSVVVEDAVAVVAADSLAADIVDRSREHVAAAEDAGLDPASPGTLDHPAIAQLQEHAAPATETGIGGEAGQPGLDTGLHTSPQLAPAAEPAGASTPAVTL